MKKLEVLIEQVENGFIVRKREKGTRHMEEFFPPSDIFVASNTVELCFVIFRIYNPGETPPENLGKAQ